MVRLELVGIEMAGKPKRGRTERDEELELIRKVLQEVRRDLPETTRLMRGQGSKRLGVPKARRIRTTPRG